MDWSDAYQETISYNFIWEYIRNNNNAIDLLQETTSTDDEPTNEQQQFLELDPFQF